MNSVIAKTDKLKKYISSAKNSGMKLLSPDINHSMEMFSIVSNGVIRMGLVGLRNVGKSSRPIIEERALNGEFKSFEDFVARLMPEKRSYESLVYAGALDAFNGTRRAKIQAMDSINEYKKAMTAHKDMWFVIPEVDEWYKSFFTIEVPEVSEMDNGDKLEKEYLYAGMYVSAHPLDEFSAALRSFGYSDISELTEDEEDSDNAGVKVEQERAVTIIGVVKELEQKLTKRGDTMYVFQVEDTTGNIRTTMFPKEVEMYGDIVHENAVVRIDGTWKNNDFGVQVIAGSVMPLADISAAAPSRYVLGASIQNIGEVLAVLDEYADNSEDSVAVVIELDDARQFVVDSDNSKQKRAIAVSKMDTVDYVKVSSSLEAFSAIRKVAKVL